MGKIKKHSIRSYTDSEEYEKYVYLCRYFEEDFYNKFYKQLDYIEEFSNIEKIEYLGKYSISLKFNHINLIIIFPIDAKNLKITSIWYIKYFDIEDLKEKTRKVHEYTIYDQTWKEDVNNINYFGKIAESIFEKLSVII